MADLQKRDFGEDATVARIRELHAEGENCTALADTLNQEGQVTRTGCEVVRGDSKQDVGSPAGMSGDGRRFVIFSYFDDSGDDERDRPCCCRRSYWPRIVDESF